MIFSKEFFKSYKIFINFRVRFLFFPIFSQKKHLSDCQIDLLDHTRLPILM